MSKDPGATRNVNSTDQQKRQWSGRPARMSAFERVDA